MISQIILAVAVVSVASASLLPVMHHAPQPYRFGYDIKDHHGEQYRQEEGNGGAVVKGSYGFTDARGIKRQVNYVADHSGFRAQVNTNEPGTANQNPAAVQVNSNAPYAGGIALGGLGYSGYGLGHGLAARANLGYGLAARANHGYGLGARGNFGYGLAASANLGYGFGGFGYGVGSGVGGLGYTRYGY